MLCRHLPRIERVSTKSAPGRKSHMEEATLFWTKVAAIGQVAGAIATAAAVIVSLWIAFHGRKPRLKLTVGIRLILGGVDFELTVLMFNIANAGERPVHIDGIGWMTGWLWWGPLFHKRKAAIQMTGVPQLGNNAPPFEIQRGAAVSTYALMDNILSNTRRHATEPFFTRDWPLSRRKITRVRAYAYARASRLWPEAGAERHLLAEASARSGPIDRLTGSPLSHSRAWPCPALQAGL